MITGRMASVLTAALPLFYRKCPMGNAHLRSDGLCDCCKGNEFLWVNGKWVLLKYAPVTNTVNHSSLSWSGQLSSGELWLSAVKQGLILALILGAIIGFGLWQAEHALRSAADGRKTNIEQAE
jgi:hypothetical protein